MTVRRAAWMLALLALAVPQSAGAAGWRALVVNDRHSDGDSVSVLDAQTDQPVRTVAVGFTPFGVAVTPDARTAWVANVDEPVPGEASLQSIDLAVTPISTGPRIPTGTDQPVGVAVTPDGTAAYAGGRTSLLRLDLTASPPALTHIPHDRAMRGFIAITPNGRTAYLSATDGTIVPVDLATATEGTPIPVGASPRGLAVTPDGTRVVVAV